MTELMRAVVVRRLGGPDVLELVEVPVEEPGPGQVRVAVRAVALNFRDVQQRLRPMPEVTLPYTPGSDYAGEVVAVGAGVTGLRVGDRVAGAVPAGACAEQVIAPAAGLLPVPAGIDFDQAAILPVAGLTASFLMSLVRLTEGATAVVYAPAGGLGCFLGGFLATAGIRAIGLTSSATKAEVALAAGYQEVVSYLDTEPVAAVRALTEGRGADVVFDSVAGPDFARSFRMAADGGTVVLCGRAAGEPDLAGLVPDFLAVRRNLALREFYLSNMIETRLAELPGRLAELLAGTAQGRFRVPVTEFGLAEIGAAHELLESGGAVGKLVLHP